MRFTESGFVLVEQMADFSYGAFGVVGIDNNQQGSATGTKGFISRRLQGSGGCFLEKVINVVLGHVGLLGFSNCFTERRVLVGVGVRPSGSTDLFSQAGKLFTALAVSD
ncbi:MAG: hypothetical protein UW94_C0001G0087 [Parcubacteria group bacterium GW2011_GWA2_45_14]|nr:MAG: hypothetical protein UW94_C0001G0087 [Parcubacteria group bacterium GW2011_GWA2_45_14]